ncbi:DUF1187 family protein [Arsenophonus apicola]|jgi:antisense regulator of RalR protein|uniref:DUF1187 family protein n=1 Tax=Arsenophonus apicola TaxID=2879119 RepID=A0ABY8NYL2_9GAMM|nr:DUF1187 family protein [Arsenophonus apicola]WGO82320.1 DUF1187 family protein [Arsenophonus apicola]
MKYQIEATLVKDGGEPVHWQRFSDKALSEKDCLKMLSQPSMFKMQFSEIGYYWTAINVKAGKQAQIKLINFICKEINDEVD